MTLWPLLVIYSPSRYNVCNLIQDKLMLLSTTTGASAADYTCMGDHGDIDVSLWPLLVRHYLRWGTGLTYSQ